MSTGPRTSSGWGLYGHGHRHCRSLTEFLNESDRHANTIVFGGNQEHASEMRSALSNLNSAGGAASNTPSKATQCDWRWALRLESKR